MRGSAMGLGRPQRRPLVYASDSFNRTDSATTLGNADTAQSWTSHVGTWGISSRKAYLVTPVGEQWQHAWMNVAASNVVVSVDVTLSPNRAGAGLRLRFENTGGINFLALSIQKYAAVDTINLDQTLAGVGSTLASASSVGSTLGSTYNLKAVISGTTCAAYINNVRWIAPTAFDGSISTQNYGVNTYYTSSVLDDGLSTFDNFLISAIT